MLPYWDDNVWLTGAVLRCVCGGGDSEHKDGLVGLVYACLFLDEMVTKGRGDKECCGLASSCLAENLSEWGSCLHSPFGGKITVAIPMHLGSVPLFDVCGFLGWGQVSRAAWRVFPCGEVFERAQKWRLCWSWQRVYFNVSGLKKIPQVSILIKIIYFWVKRGIGTRTSEANQCELTAPFVSSAFICC